MLIHKMRLDEYMAVLDVNSGAVHLVDDVIYDLLDVFDGTNDDEAIAALQTSYPEKDLREALEELHQLQAEGLLFSPEFESAPDFCRNTNTKIVMSAYSSMTAICAVDIALQGQEILEDIVQ